MSRRAGPGTLVVAFVVGVLFPIVAAAQERHVTSSGYTHWSITIGGGYSVPAIDGWEEQYGNKGGWVPYLAASYRFTPHLAIVADAAAFTAESDARTISGAISAQQQRLTLYPLTLGAELDLGLSPGQWIVPFLGAGYRRVTYFQSVEEEDRISGGANGLAGWGGFDLLLDHLDPSSASGMAEDLGVTHTYLRLEAQWASVKASNSQGGADIDLGGQTYLAGLRFTF